jgi:hypothetical protein
MSSKVQSSPIKSRGKKGQVQILNLNVKKKRDGEEGERKKQQHKKKEEYTIRTINFLKPSTIYSTTQFSSKHLLQNLSPRTLS